MSRKVTARRKWPHDGTRFLCRCDCGGDVRGSEGPMDYVASFCTDCSPVCVIELSKLSPRADTGKDGGR